MSMWGPTLLRRLAETREVIIFDNVAQVCAILCNVYSAATGSVRTSNCSGWSHSHVAPQAL